jgi:hypothetical protein
MPGKKKDAFDPSAFASELRALRDLLITNIVLISQVPSIPIPPRDNDDEAPEFPLRAKAFSDRLLEMGVDECSTDSEGNPIGIIKGTDSSQPVIVLAAHLDTVFPVPEDSYCTLGSDTITGPGLLDNSLSVGVLLSLPEILRRTGVSLKSDIVIAALNESLGRSNLKSLRSFLREWNRPIRGAVCLEGGELGRLNYFSDSMTRLEISCSVRDEETWDIKNGVNTILVLNEIVNRILEIRVPRRPATNIVFGTVKGGVKFGSRAMTSRLGLEIHSTADVEVERIYSLIEDIAVSVACEQRASVNLERVSTVNAANLGYGHPLVKNALSVLRALNIEPLIESSESELSLFLSAGIPAITLGLTYGTKYHLESSTMSIEALLTGVAQLVALIKRIDEGACDGE